MAQPAKPAPRGTRALTNAILEALDAIPVVDRKTAFRHASLAVKEKLIAQAEKAKAASRKAPSGAKRAAAVRATRRAMAEDAQGRAESRARSRPARPRRRQVSLEATIGAARGEEPTE